MCVHVFGGRSSPSYSKYTLWCTAADNEKEFGSEASDTLKKKFFVDDLLKSMKTIEEAVSLIENVIIETADNFNLIKFTNNVKSIYHLDQRSEGVKNQDLA